MHQKSFEFTQVGRCRAIPESAFFIEKQKTSLRSELLSSPRSFASGLPEEDRGIMENITFEIRCPFCRAIFKRTLEKEKKHPIAFCAYCGTRFKQENVPSEIDFSSAFLKEHTPKEEEIQGTLGKYVLLNKIGSGGMGEVFLAFDTVCGRRVALKRIRPDYISSKQLRERFIREARITSQLIHPSIISIYNIHIEHDLIYYTMPYMAGQTLKSLLAKALENEKDANADHKTSIPFLLRIFLGVLQAVAYAHSKDVLHRDLKPENIIVGAYGQVTILDWGLTKVLGETVDESTEETKEHETSEFLTKIGKPIGTLPYMAPEKAQGKPATKQTDIYALGVILYQILTLKMPFQRKNIKFFLENWQHEELVLPEVRAPYRDVPQALSIIVKKCLASDPKNRYESCDELIIHIENFLEGRSEWLPIKTLSHACKDDWEFQENILLSEHTAIVRSSDIAEWFSLSLSKTSLSENIRIDVSVSLGEHSSGIGLVTGAPEKVHRQHLTDGYWLWLASSKNFNRPTTLMRSSVCVLEAPEIVLDPNRKYNIRLEKMNQTVSLSINGLQQFVYESHIPVVGSHVGFFIQDSDFDMNSYVVSTGSLNISVNCLAVPDAFLTSGAYERALFEYRRIGESFIGRAEGREALFRAGITILEQARHQCSIADRLAFFDNALNEFEKLHGSPGAPLEYLGKALVYQSMGELDEEIKCFELAFRRYAHHPLLQVLIEHVIVRMHEGSLHNRMAAYRFVCFVLQYLPEEAAKPNSQKLFHNLKRNWEQIPFFIPLAYTKDRSLGQARMCLALAFWLNKPHVAKDIFETLIQIPILPVGDLANCCILFSILNKESLLESSLKRWEDLLSSDEKEQHQHLLSCLALPLTKSLDVVKQTLLHTHPGQIEAAFLFLLMNKALYEKNYSLTLSLYSIKGPNVWSQDLEEYIASLAIEAYLWLSRLDDAEAILQAFPQDQLTNENSPLFFYYGCFLAKTKDVSAAYTHFDLTIDTPYPRSWILAAHIITGKILTRPKGWILRSFPYEQHTLLRHLLLYKTLVGDNNYDAFIELLQRHDAV